MADTTQMNSIEIQQLKNIVQRAEAVEIEIEDLQFDKKTILEEAKTYNLDPSIVRKVLSKRKKIRKDKAKYENEIMLSEMYEAAVDDI